MSHQAKPCPRCGRPGQPASHDREKNEHRAGHLSFHALQHHHPILALLGLGAIGLSKLLPRQYRCSCGHTFSA